MASVSQDGKTGHRIVQFTSADGRRKSIRLGKATAKQAEAIRTKVERLVSSQIAKYPLDDETSRWVADLDELLADKLANAGLVAKRDSTQVSLYLREYISKRQKSVKPATLVCYGHTVRNLISFFGEKKTLREVTEADAEDFRLHLLEQKLSQATVARRCTYAKSFFAQAVRARLLEKNPFEQIKGTVRGNIEKFHFVTREETVQLLAACPDHDWRLIVALARFGGLRNPSETLSLRWQDVDWERNRIRITSPKTEHHEGKGIRVIPLFPEIKPHLQLCWDLAPEGAEYVIQRYRMDAQKTRFIRLMRAERGVWRGV